MNKLIKAAGIFVGGMLAGLVWYETRANDGDVIYENEDMYIRADKSTTGGCSWAKVFYKNPK